MNFSLPGGAAAKAKALQEKLERERQAFEERESWLDLADKTEETGVMRLVSIKFVDSIKVGPLDPYQIFNS